MPNFINPLTRAESNVLALVEQGLSNQAIAEVMSITIGTVKSHLHRSFEKLQARNRLEAIERARVQGLLATCVQTLAVCKT
jgi:ATP/maltotriose-dependent transcriptional regulator MalT